MSNPNYNRETSEILAKTARELSIPPLDSNGNYTECPFTMPSIDEIKEIMRLVRKLLFPTFFSESNHTDALLPYKIGVDVNRLFVLLQKQIAATLNITEKDISCSNIDVKSTAFATKIIDRLPDIRRQLYTDVKAIFRNDPAVANEAEVIYCYPSITAMTYYRLAHLLHQNKIEMLPRIIAEISHSETGIDIHPGATIGEYFGIDHGTGVVIGETCIIGNNVTVYQGVTLGAKNFTYDAGGKPMNLPRHPIIEDNVTIYANATVLGRITIGHDSVIGGNVWVTENVAPGSRVIQGRSCNLTFTKGSGI